MTFTNRSRRFFLLNDFRVTFQITAENQKLEVREKVMILREIHENKRKQNLSLFQNPVLTISNLWDSSKQCSSTFFEHSRGSLGKDVLPTQCPTAWIYTRRIAASSGNLWKWILGSFFLFLAWILHFKLIANRWAWELMP